LVESIPTGALGYRIINDKAAAREVETRVEVVDLQNVRAILDLIEAARGKVGKCVGTWPGKGGGQQRLRLFFSSANRSSSLERS